VSKKALRALGIAESFKKNIGARSILAGVVMRGDLVIDGFSFTTITIGGMDATDGVIRLYKLLNREDINVILLNGVVIAWFNVIDLQRVYDELQVPIIAVTYEESKEPLDRYFKEYFPDSWEKRVEVYRRNGLRERIFLKTGHEVFVRYLGISKNEAKGILNRFLLQGAIPEPLRVARLLARSLLKVFGKEVAS